MCLEIRILDKEDIEILDKADSERTPEDVALATVVSIEKYYRNNEDANRVLDKYKKVADKDITCYKWLDEPNMHLNKWCFLNPMKWKYIGKLISPFQNTLYKKNRLYHSDLPIRCDAVYGRPYDYNSVYIGISHGIHANTESVLGYYECIIPKGTVYCLGDCGDIVAESMLIGEKIEA